MNQSVKLVLMIFALMTSLASMTAMGFNIPVVAHVRTVTPNVVHPVKKILRVPRFNLLRSNPYRLATILDNPDSDVYVDDDSLLVRRRRKFNFEENKEEHISNYVKFRLFLARIRAMEAFRKAQA